MNATNIINYILEHEKLKAASFATSIGAVATQIYDLQSGKTKKISLAMANKILKTYPHYKKTWLLTGEDEIFNNNSTSENSPQVIDNEQELREAIDKGIKLLPEVNFKFAAGQAELVTGIESIKRYWFLPDCKDCEAVAQISGNSMSPTYPSGCWVALKRYGFSMDTATQIPFGSVFGVVIEDKFTGEYHGHIKILRRYKDQTLSRKYWIAHSVNETEFDDFDIEIAQVRSLWIVKQHIVSDILL